MDVFKSSGINLQEIIASQYLDFLGIFDTHLFLVDENQFDHTRDHVLDRFNGKF
jgi:hypothetical protein